MTTLWMRLIVIGGLFLLGWASTARAAIPASERQALLDLYTSTNGTGWTNSTNWNRQAGTECTWYGVLCDPAEGHVFQIDLQQNNLVGTLPSLGALTAMVHFEAGANQLSGSIPSLSGVTALTHFGVRGNLLSGSIPSLSGLTALTVFSVHDNQLTGAIPSLSGLTSLQIFYVHNNQLTGSIPSLSGLTALSMFNAGLNQLTGSIPSLGGLTTLQHFSVRTNQLTGSIPSLNGLTALQHFGASNNQLTGSIPSLSGLTALKEFWIENNLLTGPVRALPSTFAGGTGKLCGNSLVSSGDSAIDSAWTTATGSDWLACQTTAASLTVKLTGTGFGDVASSPSGISCYAPIPGYNYFAAPDCTETYAGGRSVTLTATPSEGSTFAGWSDACTGTGTCIVTVDAAKTVSATFSSDVPIVGDPAKPLTKPPVAQTSYVVTSGAMADDAATTNVEGTLGNATVTVQLDLSKVLPASFAADASYNVYVAALVPGRQLARAVDLWFVGVKAVDTTDWQELTSPIASYLQNVALGSVDQQILIEIVRDTDITTLIGTEVYIGYGTSDDEMLRERRYRGVFIVE